MTKSYTIPEAAQALDRTEDTIREWIAAGLPLMDDKEPPMILGHELKKILREKWEGRRQKCGPFEFYCCGCQKPQLPELASLLVESRKEGTFNAKARCAVCGTAVNRTLPAEDAGNFSKRLDAFLSKKHGFIESCSSSSNDDESDAPQESANRLENQPGKRIVRKPILPRNPFNERLKRDFFEDLVEAHRQSERSIRKYEIAILLFENFTKFRNLGCLTKDIAIAYKRYLLGSGLSLPVIKANLSIVRRLNEWLSDHDEYAKLVCRKDTTYFNLTEKQCRMARPVERFIKTPALEEIDRALAAMPHSSLTERRNRAMMALLALTAIRVGALATLRLEHVDLEESSVYQPGAEVDTKFSKSITSIILPLNSKWIGYLSDYVQELRDLGFSNRDPLFPRTHFVAGEGAAFGEREVLKEFLADAQIVTRLVPKCFERVGLPPYTPHVFRHVHGKLAYDEQSSMAVTKALSLNLGHGNVKTTEGYSTMDLEKRRRILTEFGTKFSSPPGGDQETLSAIETGALMEELLRRAKKRRD
ncbi:site-specific integrase [Hoeflea sp. CAU 1731]